MRGSKLYKFKILKLGSINFYIILKRYRGMEKTHFLQQQTQSNVLLLYKKSVFNVFSFYIKTLGVDLVLMFNLFLAFVVGFHIMWMCTLQIFDFSAGKIDFMEDTTYTKAENVSKVNQKKSNPIHHK